MQKKMLMAMDCPIFVSTGGVRLLTMLSGKDCPPMESPMSRHSHGSPQIPIILIQTEILSLMGGRRDIPALGIRITRESIH